jgi:hypothetical protein
VNNEARACDAHNHLAAGYQCEQCLKLLCDQCVSQDAHLFFCNFCGGHARRIAVVEAGPQSFKEAVAAAGPGILRQLAAAVTSHFIIPAAIIIMVSAFLFYLLDVRSVFLVGAGSLKRVGFFFVAATVLIARYGKVHAIRKRQDIYTAILALATLRAMTIYSSGAASFLVNVVVIAAVWRFATGVTNSLNVEEEEIETGERKLYGVERLEHEAMERKYELKSNPFSFNFSFRKKTPKSALGRWLYDTDAHGNPAKSVARLAVLAIIAFAAGEPFILAGPPEVGQRALLAVVVFLFAAGMVLAAASSTAAFQHTRQAGGKPSGGMVPGKVAAAAVLLILVLAAGLTTPGISYQGSGKLHPARPDRAGKEGSVQGDEENKSRSFDKDGKPSQQKDSRQGRGERRQQESGKKSPDSSPGQPGGSFFNFIAALGKLLIIPVVLLFIIMVVYTLTKLWPALKGKRLGVMDRLRQWLQKLRSMMGKRKSGEAAEMETPPDPRALMAAVPGLPPREAVLMAYCSLMAFFQQLGWQRRPGLTPYEFIDSLPERFNHLAEPAAKLTRLYVNAAYSRIKTTPDDSKHALELLRGLIDASGGQGPF